MFKEKVVETVCFNDEDLDIAGAGDEAIDPSLFDDPFDPWRAFDTIIIDKLLNTCHLS